MMEGELTCPVCLDLFKRPVVLPCSHNLCTTCAKRILEPRGISKDWVNWVVQNNQSSSTKSHLEPDVKCPTCRQTFSVDPRGVAALQRNLILENVIERFKEERTISGSDYDQQPLFCQFCEDFSPKKATRMCSECTFTYCGTCFDMYHPMKGPLSGHTIGPPEIKNVNRKESNVLCQEHEEEKVTLYCHECQKAVCYLCKEFGEHKKHQVELLDGVFRKTKDDMTRVLGHLMKHNKSTQKSIESFEGMCAVAKKSGSDVEAHVKKECDMLLAIIEKKKAELLQNINSAYNDKLNELHETIRRCDETLQQSLGLVEFSKEAFKENNPVTFLQTSSALKTRMHLMLDAIKDLPQVPSINPTFDHMAVDTSWERKMLKKLDWLQEPGSPSFVPSQCKAHNRSVYLVWSQPHSAVDAYHLEAEVINPPLFPGEEELREIIQVNTATNTRYEIECSRYNAKVVAKVKASNRAGDGPFSREITLKAGQGLHFTLDPSSSPHRQLVFSRDLTIAKLTNPVSCMVLGDVSLTTGRHFWKVRVDQFQGATSYAGYVAVGVATTAVQASLLGDEDCSYGVQVFENTTMWCENTHNRLQVKQKSKEFKGSNFAVLLDLDKRIMNIYLNGKLQTDQTRPKGPSFVGITGTFYPALCLYGTSVQASIQSGLHVPSRSPGIPIINLEDCSVDNTKISLAWTPPENCNVDCYILEADILNREGDVHQERKFRKVYQGPRCKYTIRGLEYNLTVIARVIAVNTAGRGDPSEEVSLSTERGVIFKLDSESIHESLKLSRGDNTVVQHVPAKHANVFGDALLADGCHYWTMQLQQMDPNNGFIAVGVARRPVQGIILGNDSSSFALQVFTETGVRTENTKNKIQLKKMASDIKGSIFGVLLDLNKEILNIYLDGELQKTATSPKGPTFKGLTGMFCAGLCLYGTNVMMSLTTGIETPPPPDAPTFTKIICKVDNTRVQFGWYSPHSKCPTDYYVLEVDVVKASEFANKKKKDRKFKRVYEGPSREYSILSVAYDMKVVGRVFGVNMAGEGPPSDDMLLSTPKGLYFQLDPTTANHELDISEDHCTVALKIPMYTFILGNVKLSTGCHYWRVHVDVFNSPNQLSIIGIGIARGILDDPILGEDSHSYAVQFNEHPTTTCINTKNRIQVKKTSKEMTNSNIGVLLNLDSRIVNIFLNGKLLTDNSRPSGPTFTGISGGFYPALSLYGTNVQLTVHTGESLETN